MQETQAHKNSTRCIQSEQKVFTQTLVLLTLTSTGVVSTFSYHLSSIHYTSSQFALNSLSPLPPTPPPTDHVATNIVCLHRQRSTPSPQIVGDHPPPSHHDCSARPRVFEVSAKAIRVCFRPGRRRRHRHRRLCCPHPPPPPLSTLRPSPVPSPTPSHAPIPTPSSRGSLL